MHLWNLAKSVPDLKITQIFPEDGNMGLVFPKYLSEWTTRRIEEGIFSILYLASRLLEPVCLFAYFLLINYELCKQKLIKNSKTQILHKSNQKKKKNSEGVNVIPNSKVSSVEARESKLILKLDNQEEGIEADKVIVAVGIVPNIELARKAGLELDDRRGGIRVNADLEARKDLFVAGDPSSYFDVALGRRRVEHYDHAVLSGRTAACNMLGDRKPYNHQPMFWLAFLLFSSCVLL